MQTVSQPVNKSLLTKLALLTVVTNDYRDALNRWMTRQHPELAGIEPEIQKLLRQRAGHLVENLVTREDFNPNISLTDYFRHQKSVAEDVMNELEKRDIKLRMAARVSR